MKKQYWLMTCIVIVGVVLWLQPPRYNSFGDAIGADLRQQGIAVRHVELVHAWPDTVNTISYGANLRVTLVSGRVVWGRLECQHLTQNCTYQVNMNDMGRRALLDLVDGVSWPQQIVQLITQIIQEFH
jgi:hypothetical protein